MTRILTGLKQFLLNVLTASLGDEVDFEVRRKVILINLIVVVGIGVLVPYCVLALVQGFVLISILDAVSACLLYATFVYLRVSRNQVVAGYLSMAYVIAFLGYLLLSGGIGGTGVLWSYTIPVFTLFMAGVVWGSVAALGYFAVAMAAFFGPFGLLLYDYPASTRQRFVGSYLTVYTLAMLYEYTREYTQRRLRERNRMLELTLDDLNRSSAALSASESRLRAFVDSFQGIAFRMRPGKPPELFSGAVEPITGYSEAEMMRGEVLWEGLIHEEDSSRCRANAQRVMANPGTSWECEYRIRRRDGRVRWVRESVQSIACPGDGGPCLQGAVYDITEQKRISESLRNSQKMESIGQLAGGIAHDFNNQLAAIMGYASLLVKNLASGTALRKHAENIVVAAGRSSDLTHQLLAFARKGKYRMEPVDVHDTIREVTALLGRSIDKRIHVTQQLNASASSVVGDSSLLRNALINIGLNARDAMPEGGELTFVTSNYTVGEQDTVGASEGLVAGEYVRIDVCDTGTGIATEDIEHVFEPFYTTKGLGKGTGLGLAAVYGSVRSHGGAVAASSSLGEGTTVTVYFPVARQGQQHTAARARQPTDDLSVLVVDDEEMVREMAHDMLAGRGHRVTTVDGCMLAVARVREEPQSYDVVLLDMVLGDINGEETFELLRALSPDLPVVIMSGYSVEEQAHHIVRHPRVTFLQKPFDEEQLMAAIQQVVG